VLAAIVAALACVGNAPGQVLGDLVSPGPLTRAHEKLEGSRTARSATSRGARSPPPAASHATSPSRSASPAPRRPSRGDGRLRRLSRGARRPRRRAAAFNVATFDHAVETGYPSTADTRPSPVTVPGAIPPARSSPPVRLRSCHATRTAARSAPTVPRATRIGRLQGDLHLLRPRPRGLSLDGAHRTVACEKCHATRSTRTALWHLRQLPQGSSPWLVRRRLRSCHTRRHAQRARRHTHGPRFRSSASTPRSLVPPATASGAAREARPRPLRRLPPGSPQGRVQGGLRGLPPADRVPRCPVRSRRPGAPRPRRPPCGSAVRRLPQAGGHRRARRRGALSTSAASRRPAHRATRIPIGPRSAPPARAVTGPAPSRDRVPAPAPSRVFRRPHAGLACVKCHPPAAEGRPDQRVVLVASRAYRGRDTACGSCHTDPHLGQSAPTVHAAIRWRPPASRSPPSP